MAQPDPDFVSENIPDTLLPPPYPDDPPSYSEATEDSTYRYGSVPMSPDYMAKLPFGQSDNPSAQILPLDPQSFPQQPASPQVTTLNLPAQRFNIPSICTPASPGGASSNAPHKVLLQPSSSRIVETKAVGHRKTESHVKDLETGKEYIVKEKTSRNGRRSKAVIKEVGGPKIVVRETPSRMVVCQKKF